MSILYALNLTADLSGDNTGFFDPYNTNNLSRSWVSSPDGGQTWSACNGGNNNSDDWGPTLAFSRSGNGQTDQVQFAVIVPNSVVSASIIVSFGRQGRTNSSNSVASPFQNGSNVNCVLGNSSNATFSSANSAYIIGPFPISVNQAAVTSNGKLNFEFSVAAIFDLGNNQVYSFGYDPELDVDVGT